MMNIGQQISEGSKIASSMQEAEVKSISNSDSKSISNSTIIFPMQ